MYSPWLPSACCQELALEGVSLTTGLKSLEKSAAVVAREAAEEEARRRAEEEAEQDCSPRPNCLDAHGQFVTVNSNVVLRRLGASLGTIDGADGLHGAPPALVEGPQNLYVAWVWGSMAAVGVPFPVPFPSPVLSSPPLSCPLLSQPLRCLVPSICSTPSPLATCLLCVPRLLFSCLIPDPIPASCSLLRSLLRSLLPPPLVSWQAAVAVSL
jgi:hypothetical protein